MAQELMNGIAVIGMAGRFPGASSIDEFWENQLAGKDVIRDFSREELERHVDAKLLDNPRFVKRGYVFDDALKFDAGCFGYTPSEAADIDPQQRWLLSIAWETLENAGYAPKSIPNDVSVGVFASVSPSSGMKPSAGFSSNPGAYMGMLLGNDKDYAASRISYKLNLHGPAMAVQTACSSSLVGVAQACQSLLDYGCDMALAGGSTIILPQENGYLSMEEGGLSADGYCHAFDHRASGMNFGNGVAMVLLKRLEDAVADGDHIHAVIRGCAVNNDGSEKVGFTAPSVSGQRAVIEEALAMAGVSASTISYVEAHGTGTPMGDPIEIKALSEAYGGDGGPCEIGSVKTNIGHLNAAAGVSGLIKAVLCLEHAEIPPLMHFEKANPDLQLEKTRFVIGTKRHAWTESPRRAGVSSFGLGGTNCHIILEQAPEISRDACEEKFYVLPFSARSETSLDECMANFGKWAESHMDASLDDVVRTLAGGREKALFRRAVVASSMSEAAEAIKSGRWSARSENGLPGDSAKVCFMFPGAGSQQPGMGRDLYESEPVFRENVDKCAELFGTLAGEDVRDFIFPQPGGEEAAAEKLNTPLGGFSALFTVEYALSMLWISKGVRPAAAGGHSFGQYAAAVVAGVMSLEDAVRVTIKRGKLMDKVQPGGMVLVFASEDQIAPLMCESLSLAVINTERLCTVAGQDADLEAFQSKLQEKHVHFRRVEASRPGHSCFMDPILGEFREFMDTIRLKKPAIPLLSNETGTWMTDEEATSAETWTRHIRSTVRFFDEMGTMFTDRAVIALEVGPGRVLTAMMRRHPEAKGRCVVPTMRDAGINENDVLVLQRALGMLFAAGVPVSWNVAENSKKLPLPTTPFDFAEYAMDSSAGPAGESGGRALLKNLMNKQASLEDWFFMPQWHRIGHLWESLSENEIPSNWLVFMDAEDVADPVAEQLEKAGCKAVVVHCGQSFRAEENNRYVINPLKEDDYAAVLKDMASKGMPPDRIVHAFTLTRPGKARRTPEDLQLYTNIGYASLICLARALAAAGMEQDLGITVLTSQVQSVTGNEELIPEKALVLGPCRVMPSEYRGIQTLNLDIVPSGMSLTVAEACTVIRETAVIPVGEADTDGWSPVAACRGNYRWEQRFCNVRLKDSGPVPLKEKGAYLITGGFGGVASVLSSYLASKYHARLVLTGRSAMPKREDWDAWLAGHEEQDAVSKRIAKVRELEANGAEVLVVQADAAVASDMECVWNEAEKRFGRINGIFHAASVAESSMIQAQTQQRAQAVLGPKVYGGLNIEAYANRMKPDFVLLFSSISSHVGALGHTDYTAACLFLDTLAQELSGKVPYRIVSVNWGYWQGVGIGLKLLPKLEELLGNDIEVRGILPEEGMQCMERVLAAPVGQAIVSTSDYAVLIDVFLKSTKDALKNYEGYNVQNKKISRPNLSTAYTTVTNAVEEVIKGVWQELLGFESLGADDNFFELGGDSLHALPMVGKLEEIFHVKVPIRVIITENSIRKLANWILSQEKIEGRTERIAQLYIKVKNMSPEEIRQMMEARRKK